MSKTTEPILMFTATFMLTGCAAMSNYSHIEQNGQKLDYGANAAMRIPQVIQIGKIDSIKSGALATTTATTAAGMAGAGAIIGGNSASAQAGAVSGLIAGVIAGGIHSAVANNAIECLATTPGWGPRMECATLTASHVMPVRPTFFMDETLEHMGLIRKIATIREDTATFNAVVINDTGNPVVFKMVGKYKGNDYYNKYPATEGWEFRVDEVTIGAGTVVLSSWNGQPTPSIKEAMSTEPTKTPLESIGIE